MSGVACAVGAAATVTLELAAPNDDVVHAYRAWRRTRGEMPWRLRETLEKLGCKDALSGTYQSPPTPWVASLSLRPDGGLVRDFLDGHRDYSTATDAVGNQGVRLLYHLRPGFVYEVGEVVPDGRPWRGVQRVVQRRYYAVVRDGAVVEIPRAEAVACLR